MLKPIKDQLRREVVLVTLFGLVVLAVYYAIFGKYFPTAISKLGHDYALYMPYMLSGFNWFKQNGLFAVPWFTPAFCGGVPFNANPLSFYYSLPQFLTFVTNPLNAVRLTLVVFAGLGFAGTHLLLRRVFELGLGAALFGAVLFTFNGFFAYRMLVGHLGFHSFMLVPLVAFWLIRPLPEKPRSRRWRFSLDAVLGGVAFAYMFQAGNVHGILPAVIALLGIGIIHGLVHPWSWSFLARLSAAAAIAVLLSTAKLAAALAFLAAFPRSGYPLPGGDSVVGVIRLVLESLFVAPPHEAAREILVNVRWRLGRHEFEYGLTPLPAVVVVAGAVFGVLRLVTAAAARAALRRHGWKVAALMLLLTLPVAVNIYSPEWNAILKQIPVIRNSSNLIRWFAAYIPIVTVLAAIAFNSLPLSRRLHVPVALALIALVMVVNAATDRAVYDTQPYSPDRILEAHRKTQETGAIPRITHMGVIRNKSGRAIQPLYRNDGLTQGISQILCYEPMFGYRLEWFPFKVLQPGPAFAVIGDVFNVKNPACFLFPEENRCSPGDHFRLGQDDAVEAFLDYRPFPFIQPLRQRLANGLNLVAIVAVSLFLAFYPLRRFTINSDR